MVKFGLNAGEVYRLVNDVITLSDLYLNFYRTPSSGCASCPMTANLTAIGLGLRDLAGAFCAI
ncbi:hypothetical protein PEC106568_29370 [Pectobacterium carotovorum subsp. carotovorum]|nr:hypothetical protein PEC106568_29370 [Pectobacterium carotovorum subsp. carotovorum]